MSSRVIQKDTDDYLLRNICVVPKLTLITLLHKIYIRVVSCHYISFYQRGISLNQDHYRNQVQKERGMYK